MVEKERSMEITTLELLVFLSVTVFAVFILVSGSVKLLDTLVAGIAVVAITTAFLFANWLEKKGIFAGHATSVFMVLVLGILMIIAGLISRGILPLFLSVGNLGFDLIFNSLIYTLIFIVTGIAVGVYLRRRTTASVFGSGDFKFMKKL